jgi:thioredoxin 2
MSEYLHVVCPSCDSINRLPMDRLSEGAKCGRCHQPLLNGKPVEVDQARFQRHVEGTDLPVLVDFWAPWCGPCHMMAPILTEAAQRLQSQLRVLKVDTDQAQRLAMQYNIRSIPTLILFKGTHEIARKSGAVDLRNLLAWVHQYLYP